jgi:hypothetical protein
MKNAAFRSFGFMRQLCQTCVLIAIALFVSASSSAAQPLQSAQDTLGQQCADASATTVAYVTQFFPLWFAYKQERVSTEGGLVNTMAASAEVTPLYHFVVAINVDTIYSGVYLDLTAEPVIVTIPATTVGYSILVVDAYGNEIPTGIQPPAPGVYAFTGPGFSGTPPDWATRISMPINFPTLFVRAVKLNQPDRAKAFIASLKTQTLSKYLKHPSGGGTVILPESFFSESFKTIADELIAEDPIEFLKQLQTAVVAPITPPLLGQGKVLSECFNTLFGDGDVHQSEFSAATRQAKATILSNYLTHKGSTNWIHFRNIADWGNNFLDRSSTTEYLQLSNSIKTAAYYHAFSDGSGQPLEGTNPNGYVLTFPAGQTPPALRFWSLTAYTPDTIELVPNTADKYAVASYTPGLEFNSDGSLSIYMAEALPSGVPEPNWLPVPHGAFNVVIRVYGPTGSVVDDTYVPPGIQKR